MKKAFTFLKILVMGIAMVFVLSACADSNTDSDTEASESNLQNPPDDSDRPINEDAKALVVYFSVPDDEDNSYVEIDGEQLGNTQYMAYVIQENTGANIFRIFRYTGNHC